MSTAPPRPPRAPAAHAMSRSPKTNRNRVRESEKPRAGEARSLPHSLGLLHPDSSRPQPPTATALCRPGGFRADGSGLSPLHSNWPPNSSSCFGGHGAHFSTLAHQVRPRGADVSSPGPALHGAGGRARRKVCPELAGAPQHQALVTAPTTLHARCRCSLTAGRRTRDNGSIHSLQQEVIYTFFLFKQSNKSIYFYLENYRKTWPLFHSNTPLLSPWAAPLLH